MTNDDQPPNMIRVRDLTVRAVRSGRVLLERVTLDVPKHRITGIIGPSGAGKSTLLRCINRLIDLDPSLQVVSGTIEIDGRDIRDPGCDPDELRQRVGIVFQQPVTFHGSIRRNVLFAAKRLGIVRRANEEELIETCLRAAHVWDEVKDRLSHAAGTLSVGQQQRLAIARSLAVNPEVILMDEPTSALDSRSTAAIERTILSLRATKTLLVVTHQLQQARRVADWIACLCSQDGSGKLVESGRCDTVFLAPRHQETRRFIGLVS